MHVKSKDCRCEAKGPVLDQAASYAGLDIAAKVVFGWAVMLSHPIIATSQTEG